MNRVMKRANVFQSKRARGCIFTPLVPRSASPVSEQSSRAWLGGPCRCKWALFLCRTDNWVGQSVR